MNHERSRSPLYCREEMHPPVGRHPRKSALLSRILWRIWAYWKAKPVCGLGGPNPGGLGGGGGCVLAQAKRAKEAEFAAGEEQRSAVLDRHGLKRADLVPY
jgi:hypothetical protein